MLPPRVRRLFRLPHRDAALAEAEMDEEIRFHFTMRVEMLMAHGMSRDAAAAEAAARFGALPDVRPELLAAVRRREGRLTMLDRFDTLRYDVSYAIRQLRRAPGFTFAVALTFALGIGANATMFGIIDRLLLQPPPGVAAPNDVYRVQMKAHFVGGEEYTSGGFSYPVFADLRDHVPEFAGIVLQTPPNPPAIGRGTDARKADAVFVDGSYFRVLGPRAVVGRLLGAADVDDAVAPPAAVISHRYWMRAYGGAPSAIGSILAIGDIRFTIVGVAPRGFVGVGKSPIDIWLPVWAGSTLSFAGKGWSTQRSLAWISLFARMKPGASIARASQTSTTVLRAGEAEHKGFDTTAKILLEPVIPSRAPVRSPEAKVATLLGGVSALVLLIACANVANLLLARAIRRRREIAVRLALGISRGRLVSQLVTESMLLATIGGVAALAVVHWASGIVRAVLLAGYEWPDSALDAHVLIFTASATILVGLLSGLLPAVQGSSLDLSRALREGARAGAAFRTRTRTALMLVQAVLSVLLLVGTGLFVRSLRNLMSTSVGLDVDRVIMASMDFQGTGLQPPTIDALYEEMLARARTLPGVTHASIGEGVSFGWSLGTSLKIPGRDSLPRAAGGGPNVTGVTEDYFATVGTHILRGRGFTAGERRGATRVGLVNETLARAGWRDANPIGDCVRIGGDTVPCTTIIGVTENAHRSSLIEDEENYSIYVPIEQGRHFMLARALLVRVGGAGEDDPARLVAPLRRMMMSTAPNLPYAEVRVMRSIFATEIRPWRLGATMFGVFGLVALVLSAVGLYSVVAYSVAQRTHEVGVRVALGASTRHILRLVVAQGMRVAVIGAGSGLVVALAAGRFIQPLLFHISPRDPLVLGLSALVMVIVATAASIVPALRAARIDPIVALRAE